MTDTDTTAAVFGTLIGLVIFAGFYVWVSLAFAAVFRKSGEEAWKAWVPILNSIILLQLAGLSPLFILLILVPGLGSIALIVVFAIVFHRLSVAFGFGIGMTVLGVVASPIWATVIGFGSARWVGRETEVGPRRSTAGDPPPLPPFRTPAAAPQAPAAASAYSVPPPTGARPPAAPSEPVAGVSAPPTQPRPVAATATGWNPPPLPTTPEASPAPAPGSSAFAPAPAAPALPAPAAPALASPAPASPAPASFAPAAAVPAVTPGAPISEPAAEPDASRESAADDLWPDVPNESTDLTGEVTGAAPGAPAPIAAVPMGARRASASEPADDAPPVTRVPGSVTRTPPAEPWAPAPGGSAESEAFPESSGPVSAIEGVADAGSPRSAARAVSAQHVQPEIPDDLDETVIASRRRGRWSLVLPTGSAVELTGEIVLVGRRPAPSTAYPGAQLIVVDDGTVSRTHLRLERDGEQWSVTDLHSTNGTVVVSDDGSEREIPPGTPEDASERLLAGDAELRLTTDASAR